MHCGARREWNPEDGGIWLEDMTGGHSGRKLEDRRDKVSNIRGILRCNPECGLGLALLVLKINPKAHSGLLPGRL